MLAWAEITSNGSIDRNPEAPTSRHQSRMDIIFSKGRLHHRSTPIITSAAGWISQFFTWVFDIWQINFSGNLDGLLDVTEVFGIAII